jgi:hypothetical protein
MAGRSFPAKPLQPLQALQSFFPRGSRVTPHPSARYGRYTEALANGSFLALCNACNGCNGLGGWWGEIPPPGVMEIYFDVATSPYGQKIRTARKLAVISIGMVSPRVVRYVFCGDQWRPLRTAGQMGELMEWARILAYISGTMDQELLLRNEYLAAENQILSGQLKGRPKLSDAERAKLGEIGRRLGRKALGDVATAALPDTILGWYRRLVARKFDGSKH